MHDEYPFTVDKFISGFVCVLDVMPHKILHFGICETKDAHMSGKVSSQKIGGRFFLLKDGGYISLGQFDIQVCYLFGRDTCSLKCNVSSFCYVI